MKENITVNLDKFQKSLVDKVLEISPNGTSRNQVLREIIQIGATIKLERIRNEPKKYWKDLQTWRKTAVLIAVIINGLVKAHIPKIDAESMEVLTNNIVNDSLDKLPKFLEIYDEIEESLKTVVNWWILKNTIQWNWITNEISIFYHGIMLKNCFWLVLGQGFYTSKRLWMCDYHDCKKKRSLIL